MEANRSHLSGHSAQIFKGQAFVDIDYYVIMFLNFSISVFKEAHSTKMEAGGEGGVDLRFMALLESLSPRKL